MRLVSANGGQFEVHCSGKIAKVLLQIQNEANEQGRGKAVAAAFRQIVFRLRQDPLSFGEPVYRLPALRMQIRTAGMRPLVIDFAVCEDRPLVFLKGVVLLPKGKS